MVLTVNERSTHRRERAFALPFRSTGIPIGRESEPIIENQIETTT